jgi:hypothetical protein
LASGRGGSRFRRLRLLRDHPRALSAHPARRLTPGSGRPTGLEPSATVLFLLRESHSADRATRNFLGGGGVAYSSPDEDGSGGPHKANSIADFFGLDAVRFPDLPGSTQEVVEAARITRGSNQLLLRRDATEAAFKALPLADFRIIHLAVHGVANTAFPDRAALVLSTSASSGEDGLFQAREIRDLSLHAELVTLSAVTPAPENSLVRRESPASNALSFSPAQSQ